MPQFTHLKPPADGTPIVRRNGAMIVPDDPIIPFIEGDGTGPDIWRASVRIFDAAVQKAFGGARHLAWFEVLAGEKAKDLTGEWLPADTLEAVKAYKVAIKGPLTTPVGGGIRSLNVTLQAAKIIEFLSREMGKRLPADSGIGIKPMSETASKRLVRMAIRFAVEHKRRSVTLMHKGNIMKFTEGAFRDWGYEVAKAEFRDQIVTEEETWSGASTDGKVVVNDRIADSVFQQVLTRTS